MYIYALNIVVALAIAIGVLTWRTQSFSSFTYETHRRNSVKATPVNLSDWQLQDTNGELIQLSDLSNQLILVDFVYTRCPTICRALGSRYEQLQKAINTSGKKNITLLSVSIDPFYDTPEKLNQYQERYNGLTATWKLARPVNDQALRSIISDTGVRIIPDEFGGLAHSDAIHLVENGILKKIDNWDSIYWEKLISNGTKT